MCPNKGMVPLWLNRGGLLVNSHSTVIVSSSVINSAVKPPDRAVLYYYGTAHSKLFPGHVCV